MRVLIASHLFYPSVGGIEEVALMLARGLSERGHSVDVVTQTPDEKNTLSNEKFTLYRKPSARVLIKRIRAAEVVLHCNISLRSAWPLLLWRKPWLLGHHIMLDHGGSGMAQFLKQRLLQRALNYAPSQSLASTISPKTRVVPNAYKNHIFRIMPKVDREQDLIYVGRLVSDKGVDLLLEALKRLHQHGIKPTVSIIGDGPLRAELESFTAANALSESVTFKGILRGEVLALELNRHKIMVIPSRWAEPFGIVALEGIACGCHIVAARSGGLPEAVGPCGDFFESLNVGDLAATLEKVLQTYPGCTINADTREAHLKRFQPKTYLDTHEVLMAEAIESTRK